MIERLIEGKYEKGFLLLTGITVLGIAIAIEKRSTQSTVELESSDDRR